MAEENGAYDAAPNGGAGVIAELPRDELARIIRDLEGQMRQSAKMLEFEKAGQFRDQIIELRKVMEGDPADLVKHVVTIDANKKQPQKNGRAEKAGVGADGKGDDKAGGKAAPRRRSRYS